MELAGVGEPVFIRETVDAANHGDRETLLGLANQGEMFRHRVVGHMLGHILIAVAIVAHGGVDMGVALDVVDNLFLENRLQHHGACAGLLELAEVVDISGEAAAAGHDGALQIQPQIFDTSIHSY